MYFPQQQNLKIVTSAASSMIKTIPIVGNSSKVLTINSKGLVESLQVSEIHGFFDLFEVSVFIGFVYFWNVYWNLLYESSKKGTNKFFNTKSGKWLIQHLLILSYTVIFAYKIT